MALAGLLPLISGALPGFGALQQALRSGEGRASVPEEAKAPLVAALAAAERAPLLVVTARPGRVAALVEQLRLWLGDGPAVLPFPEPDVLPYERLNPDGRIVADRLSALLALASEETRPLVVVASAVAAATTTLSPDGLRAAGMRFQAGQRLNWDTLGRTWLRLGYEPVVTVEAPGQFTRRGGIIDAFPFTAAEPFRIELFGDEIDNIRLFDPATQRSTELADAVAVLPARELLGPPWAETASLALDACNPAAREQICEDLRRLTEGGEVATPWFYAPVFNRWTLFDHLPAGTLVVLDEPGELRQALADLRVQTGKLRAQAVEQGDLPRDFPEAVLSGVELDAAWSSHRRLALSRWAAAGAPELDFVAPPVYAGRLRALFSDLRVRQQSGGATVLVSLQSDRLREVLAQEEIAVRVQDRVDGPPPPGSVLLLHGGVAGGWTLRDARGNEPLALLTDAELFGFVKEQRRRLARRPSASRENPLHGLTPGDHVVHVEHGIGRFRALVTMEAQPGVRQEYLHLEYAGGATLYVPAGQVDRVARYVGPGGHAPALSRLGTQDWDRAKDRVKRAAQVSAREMLDTVVARQVQAGRAVGPDTVWQQEMEASFPYVETPDQLAAVRDVKADMEAASPMDRLVCGDVGYGKTEVAVRAAFKAVQAGTQVAVLVPTTVLAQQHHQTFTQRLGAFPVKVDTLSRFRSEREQRSVLGALATGGIDIIIGTHRLLQRDVVFKDLGLAIVDEEQRFGVLHKEHFKRLRSAVDVLTLSATPIPRTLHMALVGVRDLSMMETPPEERLPIKTSVQEFDGEVVRHAIIRELERGGQVFVVHNRVQSIGWLHHQFEELVPEASFTVGHGQMEEEALEQVMLDFSAGKHDVLICTTIIESGLDLPNVNTIIINDADKLGLAQLYQLRGRVGRGANRAYAYLLYTRNKALSEPAQKRLQAVFEATELGAGYFIAMKDLEIRGAGNLLGVEQSGHIGAVGFDLYCRILASAVDDAKAEQRGEPAPSRVPVPPEVVMDLRIPAYLPEDYVPGMNARLELYRRLAELREGPDVDEIEQEVHDRFGPAPAPVRNLLFVVRAKLAAVQAGAATVQQDGDALVVRLLDGFRVMREPLAGLAGVSPGQNQVRIAIGGPPERWQPRVEEALRRMRRG